MKKRFDRSGTARRKAVTAIAALTMALVLAVGGAGAATLLSAQPETLTVGAVVPHITAEAPQQTAPADPAPAAESTATAPEQTAESTAQPQQAESVPEQAKKTEIAETAPAEPEEAAAAPETPETPAQPAEDTALEEENSPAMLLEETPDGLNLDEVRTHLENIPRVVAVHDLHASTVSTGMPMLMAHVVVEPGMSMDQAANVLSQLQDCLREHFPVSIPHTTFQLEPQGYRSPSAEQLHS